MIIFKYRTFGIKELKFYKYHICIPRLIIILLYLSLTILSTYNILIFSFQYNVMHNSKFKANRNDALAEILYLLFFDQVSFLSVQLS